MTLHSALRVDHLHLSNFRCFTECSVDFDPSLTVLVAENGRGKTAILDAVGLALRVEPRAPREAARELGLERTTAGSRFTAALALLNEWTDELISASELHL